MWRKIHIEAIDSISGEPLCLLCVCGWRGYQLFNLPVLGIVTHNAGRKLLLLFFFFGGGGGGIRRDALSIDAIEAVISCCSLDHVAC